MQNQNNFIYFNDLFKLLIFTRLLLDWNGKNKITIDTIAIIIALIRNKYVNSNVIEYNCEIKNTEIGPEPNAKINLIPYTTP